VLEGEQVRTTYRIEIDLVVEDTDESAILDAARRQYLSSSQAWAEENGRRVLISAEQFIPDIESALLELVDANFQLTVPNLEPLALRCIALSHGSPVGTGSGDEQQKPWAPRQVKLKGRRGSS
jgi:hypothetical protein